MGDNTYRVGIVGLRGITAKGIDEPIQPFRREIVHSHAAGLAVIDGFDIVAVCDLIPDLLDDFAKTWSERWPNAKPYDDFSQMLREADLDILAIATGDHTHAALAVEAARLRREGHLLRETPCHQHRGRGQAHRDVRSQQRRRDGRSHPPLPTRVDTRPRRGQAWRNRKAERHRGDSGRPKGDDVQERHSHDRHHLHVRRVGARPGLGQAWRKASNTGTGTRATAASSPKTTPGQWASSSLRTGSAPSTAV